MFVTVVPNCSKEALIPVIQGTILEGSTIHTDGWSAYDWLILNGCDHYRVYLRQNKFARVKSHVNGTESLCSFAKRRLSKFNGLTSKYFVLHLKECEFRFNHRGEDLLPILWAIASQEPIFL